MPAISIGSSLDLTSDIHARINVKAKGISIAHVALLGGKNLPVDPRQATSIHVARVGGEFLLDVVSFCVDAPFLDVDELIVSLLQPRVVAIGPLVGV